MNRACDFSARVQLRRSVDCTALAETVVLVARLLCLGFLVWGAVLSIRLARLLSNATKIEMMRIEARHTFPVPVNEAFAYITDMSHWSEYWPDFVRIQNPASARWSEPGDMVMIVLRLLNRERALIMRLEQFRTDALVTYVSHQQGLPDVLHERHFTAVPGGFEYQLVVAYQPRRGLAGVFDRLFLRRAVARALRKTIVNLEQVFLERALYRALR